MRTDETPQVHRPLNGRTQVWMPYRSRTGNRYRLEIACGRRASITWRRDLNAYTVASTHTAEVIRMIVSFYGRALVALEGATNTTCCHECWSANPGSRAYCVCGCAGTNHASGGPLGKDLGGVSVLNGVSVAKYLVGTADPLRDCDRLGRVVDPLVWQPITD